MKKLKHIFSITGAIAAMILLILDTETAKNGVAEGLSLCLKVIVPSLFPFFIITSYLNSAILGLQIPGFRTIGNFLHIPAGSESILLLGLIGGYPVGAQLISDAYRQGHIDRRTGQVLLGYCSNAGPAFIFGITSVLFTSSWISFCLWAVHMISAIVTGLLLPKSTQARHVTISQSNVSFVKSLKRSIVICTSVCGWIIVFKTILVYIDAWLTGLHSEIVLSIIGGFLELSNGCLRLSGISSASIRFIVCSAFLAFGGICVLLQTASVTEGLGLGLYIPGKIIQTCISLILSLVLSHLLFQESSLPPVSTVILISLSVLITIILKQYAEKSCGNSGMIHV